MPYLNTAQFDPNNKGASVTLSGSNLIATVSSGTGTVRVRNKVSGLTYFEMVVGGTLTGSCRIGLCNNFVSHTTLLGVDNNGISYGQDGIVRVNNATVATLATYTAGDNIGVAFDPVRNLVWFRKNGGNWNNDVIANQNPVGAVGGISTSVVNTNTINAAWGGTATASVTGQFATASWTYGAPTGYVQLDDLQASGNSQKLADHPSRAGTFTYWTGLTTKALPHTRRTFATDAYVTRNIFNTNGVEGGRVSGQVQESGSPVAGRLVCVYDARTFRLIDRAYTDGSGNYSIDCGGRPEVFVVAFDPTAFQALAFDRVIPV